MILPRRHLRHERERGGLEIRARCVGRLSPLPRDHALEALVERLQLALLVDAMLAVRPALDRHAAALARVFVAHDFFLFLSVGSSPSNASTNACIPRSSASQSRRSIF